MEVEDVDLNIGHVGSDVLMADVVGQDDNFRYITTCAFPIKSFYHEISSP